MKIAPKSILILSVFLFVLSSCRYSSTAPNKLKPDEKTEEPKEIMRDSSEKARPGDVSYPELPAKERRTKKPGSDLDTLLPIKA